jgi:hypothetical protein
MRDPVHSKPFMNWLNNVRSVVHEAPKDPLSANLSDRSFVKFVPMIATRCKIKIPYLQAVASRYSEGLALDSTQIYTPETCKEFHLVLCSLLQVFFDSLESLHKSKEAIELLKEATNGSKEVTKEAKVAKDKAPKEAEAFPARVWDIAFIGSCLRAIAYGTTIEVHLQTIEHLLLKAKRGEAKEREKQEKQKQKDDDKASAKAKAKLEAKAKARTKAKGKGKEQEQEQEEQEQEKKKKKKEDNDEDKDEDEDEEDTELLSVQPDTIINGTTPLAIWESCRDWLRLMVTPFEAVDILLGHIFRNPPSTGISITTIAIPHQGTAMLHWKDLLCAYYHPHPDPTTSNTDMPTLEQVIAAIDSLPDDPDLAVAKHFSQKFDVGRVFSETPRFTGTLHCELLLAILMYLMDHPDVDVNCLSLPAVLSVS